MDSSAWVISRSAWESTTPAAPATRFGSLTGAQAPAADVVAFDRQVTQEDKGVLETTDWDTPLDLASGEEKHMPTDQPGMMMRKRLLELLNQHGEEEARLPGRQPARMPNRQAV